PDLFLELPRADPPRWRLRGRRRSQEPFHYRALEQRGRIGGCRQQIAELGGELRLACGEEGQRRLARRRLERQQPVEFVAQSLPRDRAAHVRVSSRCSQIRAAVHSRLTVASDNPSASPVSSSESPP